MELELGLRALELAFPSAGLLPPTPPSDLACWVPGGWGWDSSWAPRKPACSSAEGPSGCLPHRLLLPLLWDHGPPLSLRLVFPPPRSWYMLFLLLAPLPHLHLVTS